MSFSGTITESNGMTMTRLIERIVHTDTPGELRLHDEPSGRRACVAIRRGMVQEVSFGELTGNPALTAISQVMPWTFEFIADEAGARPAHPSMVSRSPRARAVVKAAPRPAIAPAEASPEPPAVADPAPSAPAPALTEFHRQWLTADSSAHCIRFGTAGEEFAGGIQPDDYDYFRSDFAFLRATAAGIARSLGWDAPAVVAIAEPERSTGYAMIEDGFLGIMAGAGSGVQHVIDFPEGSAP
ncbi:MAG TPA: hypothetical protein VG796_23050 [Verrucomicrobiales bacterium]|nr:hypothetical protein [Verrucomicrobiales bacterium]